MTAGRLFRCVAVERRPLLVPQGPSEVWSIDFVMDALEHGRRLKCLTIVDDFTKEAIDIVVDHGISGQYVARVLEQAGRFRELPRVIRTDQGPEFTGKALDQWASERGITLRLIQAGKLCRKFQWQVPRRVLERALVPVTGGGARDRRRVAHGLQPSPPAQCAGISDAGGVRRCLAGPAYRARQAGKHGVDVTWVLQPI